MLIGSEVRAAALGARFAVDVGVGLQVADDGRRQGCQSAGINALAKGRAAGLQKLFARSRLEL